MKEEKKYQITGTTNGWIAQRDLKFNGKTRSVSNIQRRHTNVQM